MKEINNYKDLLSEEERISREIEMTKSGIEADFQYFLKPKNLFDYFESKLEKKVREDFQGEFELQKYLVSLSLDFLYKKLSESLINRNTDNKNSAIDWRVMVKALVDRFYINNKPMIIGLVSDFIDKNVEKIEKLINK